MRNGIISLGTLLCMSTVGWADSLGVQYLGAVQNDGANYVLPYELSINGVDTEAICYDFTHEIWQNEMWLANELTLGEAQAGGEFSGSNYQSTGYQEVAWLASYFFTTPALTTADQVDLQHAIWDVFDPGEFALPNDSFLNSVWAAESSGMADLNYADYVFLEAIPSADTVAQSFVIYEPIGSGGGGQQELAPEPANLVLAAIGIVLIGLSQMHSDRALT